jgi:hypothetical protein
MFAFSTAIIIMAMSSRGLSLARSCNMRKRRRFPTNAECFPAFSGLAFRAYGLTQHTLA